MKVQDIKLKELLKFLVGGGSAVVVDYITYIILMNHIGIVYAKGISYVLGAIVGFIINKLWTFESKSFKLTEIIKYIVLYACSAFVNTIINKLVLFLFSSSIFAFLCATGVSTIINFLGQKFFVFRRKEQML